MNNTTITTALKRVCDVGPQDVILVRTPWRDLAWRFVYDVSMGDDVDWIAKEYDVHEVAEIRRASMPYHDVDSVKITDLEDRDTVMRVAVDEDRRDPGIHACDWVLFRNPVELVEVQIVHLHREGGDDAGQG